MLDKVIQGVNPVRLWRLGILNEDVKVCAILAFSGNDILYLFLILTSIIL